jgi:hypothetical protein
MPASLVVNATTFNWITLRGEVEPLGMVLEDVTRPGVNGHAYRQVGQRGQAFDDASGSPTTRASPRRTPRTRR